MAAVSERNGRAREGEAPGGGAEGQPDAVAPGPVVAGVVELVEDHEGVGRRCARRRPGLHGHLLVGDDDAVHVGGQAAVAGRPLGLEVEVEAAGGPGPLELEVLGGRHHDDPPVGVRGQVLHRGGEREGGLAGARAWRPRGSPAASEAWKRSRACFLPGPEADGTRHRRTAECTDPITPPRATLRLRTGRTCVGQSHAAPTSSPRHRTGWDASPEPPVTTSSERRAGQ